MNKTSTSKIKRGFICAIISAVILSFIAPVSADVVTLYAQGFANNSGANKTMADYGWETYGQTNATTYTGNVRIYTNNGGSAISNVNALSPYGDDIIAGIYMANVAGIQFAFTSLAVNRSDYKDITLSYDIRTGSTAISRLAVAINGSWYVAEDTYTSDNSAFETHSLVLDGAKLIAMDFSLTAPKILGISGSPAVNFSDIAGDITAVGFFFDPNNSGSTTYVRADNFIVTATAVPEPATLGLLLISIAGIFGIRRIRENRA